MNLRFAMTLIPLILASCQACPSIKLAYVPPDLSDVPLTMEFGDKSGNTTVGDGHKYYSREYQIGWQARLKNPHGLPIIIAQDYGDSEGRQAGFDAADKDIENLVNKYGKRCVRRALGKTAVP